jgi:transcriptional regulator with XRE-family HTH domain
MAVSDVIRELRRKSGMSQLEVAARAGLSRNTIARYERGAMQPTTMALINVARGLGCTIDELLELPGGGGEIRTVYVVMYNDACDSVWLDQDRANTERDRLHNPDKGRFVRVYPFCLNLPGNDRP